MIVIGVDVHEHEVTVVAVDERSAIARVVLQEPSLDRPRAGDERLRG